MNTTINTNILEEPPEPNPVELSLKLMAGTNQMAISDLDAYIDALPTKRQQTQNTERGG